MFVILWRQGRISHAAGVAAAWDFRTRDAAGVGRRWCERALGQMELPPTGLPCPACQPWAVATSWPSGTFFQRDDVVWARARASSLSSILVLLTAR
ncbi:hypothetical protein C8Q74DRAFT_1293795 [Fomes fomentarius]|nr:hypothetical protein C8Q74DRAFT_1293795 [Fomes fomentarius]